MNFESYITQAGDLRSRKTGRARVKLKPQNYNHTVQWTYIAALEQCSLHVHVHC